MKREFLQLAQIPKYGLSRHLIGSEKLDGERCFWDGGISRGLLKCEVPWANTSKDERFKRVQYATGLWTRYGNPIYAAKGWLDRLPPIPLDGELFCGRNNRQRLISIVRKQEADVWEWREVTYRVFDVPPLDTIFETGVIDTPHYFKIITPKVLEWVKKRESVSVDPEMKFLDRLALAKPYESKNMKVLEHVEYEDEYAILADLERLTDIGAEGMVLRRNTEYQCCRSHDMIKLKKLDDAEGTVIGYTTGRETNKGSKLLGLMGAMKIRMDNGIELDLSGFSESERVLRSDTDDAAAWARSNPDMECPATIEAKLFPRGSRVTFRYRGKSKEGVPQEARYWRPDDRLI